MVRTMVQALDRSNCGIARSPAFLSQRGSLSAELSGTDPMEGKEWRSILRDCQGPPDADPHVRWCGGRRGNPRGDPISLQLLFALACLSRVGWDAPEKNSNNDANAHEHGALTQVTERPIQTRQKTAHGDDSRGYAYSEIKHSAPVRWLWVVQAASLP